MDTLSRSLFLGLFLFHIISNLALKLVKSSHGHKRIHSEKIVVHWVYLSAETGPNQASGGDGALLRIGDCVGRPLEICNVGD